MRSNSPQDTRMLKMFPSRIAQCLGAVVLFACSSPAATTGADGADSQIANGDVGPELGVGQI